jgi:hypothetical protein
MRAALREPVTGTGSASDAQLVENVLTGAWLHGWSRRTIAEVAHVPMLAEELKLRPGRHCRCPLHRPDFHAWADTQRNGKNGG